MHTTLNNLHEYLGASTSDTLLAKLYLNVCSNETSFIQALELVKNLQISFSRSSCNSQKLKK